MTEIARTQKQRLMAIDTPIGEDKVLLLAMNGVEALGQLFQFELDLVSEGVPIDYSKILGQNVTVRLDMLSKTSRYFNGYISKFTFASFDDARKDHKKIYRYRATMVPWTWFLTRKSDCRIFQDMTVQEIIEKIFRDAGFTDFSAQLTGTYRKWEYCVQYRETDFNFISRLMENEGIYYYFKHENGKHTLVMCDAPSAHQAATDYDKLHFDTPDVGSTHDAYVWDWSNGHQITPNQYALTDYNPLKPQTLQEKIVNVDHGHDPGTYEMFDYPGGYAEPADGRVYANIRMEELEAQYNISYGTSSARGIHAGATFKFVDHPAFEDEEYLITGVQYQLSNDDMGLSLGRPSEKRYTCQITCIPKIYEYRTPRTTPKPVVQGPQTAKVVGPSGEEIHTDKYGRVKVHFYWDRNGKENETASCWVRVSQPWAGKKWGAINIPRCGQEVIVEFLEGDPDRPIITGRVYNGDNMPPYALPDNKTITSFKSNSSKGGAGFNELRFEDKKGEEQIYIYGEKNLDIRIKNDRFESIGNDRHLVVEKCKFEHIKKSRNELIDENHSEEITKDRSLKITGKEAKTIGGTQSLKVTGAVTEEFSDNHSEVVTKDYYLKGDNLVIEALTSLTIKVGKNTISFGSDGIKIACEESGGTFELLSMGDTTIESKAAGSIKTTSDLTMEATGNASLKGTAGLKLETSAMGSLKATGMLAVESSAILNIKGSMVNIN